MNNHNPVLCLLVLPLMEINNIIAWAMTFKNPNNTNFIGYLFIINTASR
jgi:hypothetical protein